MDTFDRFFIIFLISFFISLSTAVIYTAWEIKSGVDEIVTEYKQDRVSLPERCREFYRDGTDNWVRCMNVEAK